MRCLACKLHCISEALQCRSQADFLFLRCLVGLVLLGVSLDWMLTPRSLISGIWHAWSIESQLGSDTLLTLVRPRMSESIGFPHAHVTLLCQLLPWPALTTSFETPSGCTTFLFQICKGFHRDPICEHRFNINTKTQPCLVFVTMSAGELPRLHGLLHEDPNPGLPHGSDLSLHRRAKRKNSLR